MLPALILPCLLAASALFIRHGWPIFYVDPWQDRLYWAAGQPGRPSEDLPNRLRIPKFCVFTAQRSWVNCSGNPLE